MGAGQGGKSLIKKYQIANLSLQKLRQKDGAVTRKQGKCGKKKLPDQLFLTFMGSQTQNLLTFEKSLDTTDLLQKPFARQFSYQSSRSTSSLEHGHNHMPA